MTLRFEDSWPVRADGDDLFPLRTPSPRGRGDRVVGYVIGAVLAAAFFLLGLAAGGCS